MANHTDLSEKELAYISDRTLGSDLTKEFRKTMRAAPSKKFMLSSFEWSMGKGKLIEETETNKLEDIVRWLREKNEEHRSGEE